MAVFACFLVVFSDEPLILDLAFKVAKTSVTCTGNFIFLCMLILVGRPDSTKARIIFKSFLRELSKLVRGDVAVRLLRRARKISNGNSHRKLQVYGLPEFWREDSNQIQVNNFFHNSI